MKRLYGLLLLVLLILVVIPRFMSSYALGVFILIFFYAYLGQSWNILTGYTGIISLGHSLYLGIGAYATIYLTMTLGLSPWVGMWVGGICAGLVGLVIGYFGFRFGLRGVYFVLLTISFAEIGRLLFLHLKVLSRPISRSSIFSSKKTFPITISASGTCFFPWQWFSSSNVPK
jgi:branched-chain amino acid transport system permease protein